MNRDDDDLDDDLDTDTDEDEDDLDDEDGDDLDDEEEGDEPPVRQVVVAAVARCMGGGLNPKGYRPLAGIFPVATALTVTHGKHTVRDALFLYRADGQTCLMTVQGMRHWGNGAAKLVTCDWPESEDAVRLRGEIQAVSAEAMGRAVMEPARPAEAPSPSSAEEPPPPATLPQPEPPTEPSGPVIPRRLDTPGDFAKALTDRKPRERHR